LETKFLNQALMIERGMCQLGKLPKVALHNDRFDSFLIRDVSPGIRTSGDANHGGATSVDFPTKISYFFFSSSLGLPVT